MEYQKIHTIFKRESQKPCRIIEGQFSLPEFEYLKNNQWQWTEKVDGTNIRVYWDCDKKTVRIAGRTDNAQIPTFLHDKLQQIFSLQKFSELYPETSMILYGEGYGAKIQKGGGNYISNGVDFVLFDIRINSWWLERDNIEEIANILGIRVVPVVETGKLFDAVEIVRKGEKSQWGNFFAEGLVGRTTPMLFRRNGEMIITKIKHKDFK